MAENKRKQICEILNAYHSIIDFDESNEVFHLLADLVDVMEDE